MSNLQAAISIHLRRSSVPNNANLPRRQHSNGIGIRDFFLFKDQRRQLIGGAEIGDGDRALQDDRALIVFVVGEVNGAAADFYASFNRRFVNMMAKVIHDRKRPGSATDEC
jgi:hypothetical protein